MISRGPSPACSAAGPRASRVASSGVPDSASRHAAQNRPRFRSPSPRPATQPASTFASDPRRSNRAARTRSIEIGVRGSRNSRSRTASTGTGVSPDATMSRYAARTPPGRSTFDGGAMM